MQYKTRHDWVGKVFHLELCKKFKFGHTNKCNMHNPESVLKTMRTNSLGLLDTSGSFNLVQTTNQVIVNKKRTYWIVDFTVSADHRVKQKKAKRDTSTKT